MGAMRRLRASITYPIVATLVLLTVVPLVGTGLWLARLSREYLTTLEKQYLTRQAVSLAAEVELFVANRRARLETLAATLAAVGAPRRTERLLEGLTAADPALLQLQLLDAAGRGPFVRVKDLPASTVAGLNEAFARLHREALARDSAVEDRYEGEGLPWGAWLIALPVPRGAAGGWRVVEAALDLSPLGRRLADPSLGGLLVSVVDARGRVVLASDPELRGADLSGNPLVEAARKAPVRLTLVYPHPRRTDLGEVLGSVAPVPRLGWATVVERPVESAFATVRRMQRWAVGGSVVAALAALGFGIVLSRRFVRPIQELARVSSRIAEGELAERAEVSGRDEIAQLAANFNQMAGSVEMLVRRLRRALRQNQELFLETIRTLAAAIDAKDPYTRGHSERVSSYSMAVARHLGLGQDEVFRIRIAAILHDVGKLGIRDDILKKPGGLTEAEYEEIKRHPAIGAQIMEPIRLLKDILPGIRNHHERWDGSGYPDGLAGAEIPMVARIIGVADTFDAMTTDRPYQRALSVEAALARMQQMATTHFDPTVVEALVKAVRAGDITPPERRSEVAR